MIPKWNHDNKVIRFWHSPTGIGISAFFLLFMKKYRKNTSKKRKNGIFDGFIDNIKLLIKNVNNKLELCIFP